MTATNEAALGDAIDRIAIDYANEDYESCLRRCSSLLFDDEHSLTQRVQASLYVFMRECCAFLLERVAPPSSSGQPTCSFCGKSPPDVRLGAGPSAFVCDGCVDLFARHFEEAVRS
jgi:hypothetical protein